MNGWWFGVILVGCLTVVTIISSLTSTKRTPPPKERCMFDGHWWLVGGGTVGGQPCSGDPDMRVAFVEGHPAQHLTGRLVCTGHVGATSELAAKMVRDALS